MINCDGESYVSLRVRTCSSLRGSVIVVGTATATRCRRVRPDVPVCNELRYGRQYRTFRFRGGENPTQPRKI